MSNAGSGKKLVVLVEPVQNYRMFVERALEGSEFEVVTVKTGEEAMSLLTSVHPDVIVTEDNLLGSDGATFLLQVREKGVQAPTVVLSAYGRAERIGRYASLSVSDFLIKPIDAERLLNSLRLATNPMGDIDALLTKLPSSSGPTILIADDVGASRLMLATHLKTKGYSPVEAEDGAAAIQRIRAGGIALLLLDFQMRGMGGLETLKALRKENKNLPVVLMSAHATPEQVAEARTLGIVDFFPKPIDVPRLLDRIGEVLGSGRAARREKKTILVVDDDPGLRRVMQTLLGASGYTVLTAEDGFSARSEIEYASPNLILLDMNLPGVDGQQLLREIEAKSPDVPVIIISAYLTDEDQKTFLKGPVRAIFRKPANMNEVRAKVTEILEKPLNEAT